MKIKLEIIKCNIPGKMGRKKKKLSVETTFLNFLNMELLLNLLRHKINLYRNKQGQYSKKHLLQKITRDLVTFFLDIVGLYH